MIPAWIIDELKQTEIKAEETKYQRLYISEEEEFQERLPEKEKDGKIIIEIHDDEKED